MSTCARKCVVTLSILFTLSNQALAVPEIQGSAANTKITSNQGQLQIGLDSDRANPLVKIDVESAQLDSSPESNQKIADVVAKKSNQANTSVLISTDSDDLLTQVLKTPSLKNENIVAIPVAEEGDKKTKFGQVVDKFVQDRAQSIKNDRIGFMVVTYTTAAETLVWIHSTHLSHFESTSNAIYTVVLSIIFGIYKEQWVNTARPLQKFFRNLIKPSDASHTNGKEIAARFLGNLSLAMVVTGLRIPLISMSQIIEHGIQLHYFSMPLLLATVSTAATFMWGEHFAMINEKITPLTKTVFRRTNEFRAIVVGSLATSAALLNPAEYGASPWITVAAMGVAGGLIYFNGESITKWIESRKILQPIKSYLEKQKAPAGAALFCRQLFAN